MGSIGASRSRLLLTNYESLTMAAQFPDITLPEAHERGQVLSVSPGLYDCRIVQLSDPESVRHSRSRSVLSMSLRELHHRERFGARFPGARPDHALQRIRPDHFDAKIPPHDVDAR